MARSHERAQACRTNSRAGLVRAAIRLALLAPLLPIAPAAFADSELPTGGQVVSGQATVSESANVMTIHQSSDRLIANWQSFSIGAGNSVKFEQPGASSVALNRVVGQDPSCLQGSLEANGRAIGARCTRRSDHDSRSRRRQRHLARRERQDAANGKGVTPGTLTLGNGNGLSANYTLAGGTYVMDVTPRTISAITGITAVNKTYDGTTIATVDAGSAAFAGKVAGDVLVVGSLSGAFSDKNERRDSHIAISYPSKCAYPPATAARKTNRALK